MSHIDNIIQHAEQHCKDHGARLTAKRKQILAQLIQSNKALSAYELMDRYKDQYHENIPAMSVYRILEFLEGEHLVHKLNLANKYVACAHISCDHSHGVQQFLICGNCSKVKEVNISQSTISELNETVKDAGYQLVSPQIEINCLCKDCSKVAA